MGRLAAIIVSAAIGGLLMPQAQAAAVQPDMIDLEPSSHWNADFGDESCALKRKFGEGANEVMLELRKYGPTRGFELTVMGPALKPNGRGFSYRFDAREDLVRPKRYMTRDFEGGFKGITATAFLGPKLRTKDARENRAEMLSSLFIEEGFSSPLALKTGTLGTPMKVLDHCTKNLMVQWGLIEDVDGKRPKMSEFANRDRVSKELRRKLNGRVRQGSTDGWVRARIMVDAEGNATSCHPQAPVEDEAFDKIACQAILRLARFEPSTDEAGNQQASYYLLSSTFNRR